MRQRSTEYRTLSISRSWCLEVAHAVDFFGRVPIPSALALPGLSAAPCRLDRGNVDLLHAHHRVERTLGFSAAGRQRLGEHARRDLPGDAPFVLAPAARALLAAIAD